MSLFNLQHRERLGSTHTGIASSGALDELESLTARISAWCLKEHNEDGTHNIVPSGFDFVPIGAMMDWFSATPPPKWLVCDGSQVSRTTYAALFAEIGTLGGIGDGSTTFNLPDFRGKSPVGKTAAGTASTLGSSLGALDHTHTVPALSVPALSVPALSVPALSVPALGVSITTSSDGSHNHGGATGGPPISTANFLLAGSGAGFSVWAFSAANDYDLHTHSISSAGAHTHSVSGNTGTGSTGTGSTGTGSTGTGSTGTGTSGTSNHACLVTNRIILAGV